MFKEQLSFYQDIINSDLKKQIAILDKPEKLLYESMNYSLLAGGKRLRPVLLLSTYMLFRKDYEKCIPYMMAIEMIHNFSLIHDDLPVIDDDDFRHSKPTNHKVYGDSTALLAGDALLNFAYVTISKDLLNEQDNDEKVRKLKVFEEISNATNEMIIGEFVDIDYEEEEVSLEELEYMHSHKTGALINTSVKSGAILAGASDEAINKLTIYAKNIGLAFQIKDDILSEIGDEKDLGKPVGNDKEKKKSTYVTKLGLEKSEQILNDKISVAIDCLEEFGSEAQFLRELALYIKSRNK